MPTLCNIQARVRQREFPQIACRAQDWCNTADKMGRAVSRVGYRRTKRVHHFGPFQDLLHSTDVSPDGKYLVTGHMGSDGRIWEIATGKLFRRLGKNVYPPG